MNFDIAFNLVEGIWWIALGGWVLIQKGFGKSVMKYCLGIILVLFGVSDFVEMHSGAWWSPWWLFVWKAVCLAAGIILIIHIIISERRAT